MDLSVGRGSVICQRDDFTVNHLTSIFVIFKIYIYLIIKSLPHELRRNKQNNQADKERYKGR
jgi:hypothetical protein